MEKFWNATHKKIFVKPDLALHMSLFQHAHTYTNTKIEISTLTAVHLSSSIRPVQHLIKIYWLKSDFLSKHHLYDECDRRSLHLHTHSLPSQAMIRSPQKTNYKSIQMMWDKWEWRWVLTQLMAMCVYMLRESVCEFMHCSEDLHFKSSKKFCKIRLFYVITLLFVLAVKETNFSHAPVVFQIQ